MRSGQQNPKESLGPSSVTASCAFFWDAAGGKGIWLSQGQGFEHSPPSHES